ncbi:MAG TPA: metallophosphoesterase, partial [Bacillales bacterium]|nr:metallophosphoesterase [Bacillales bacterium]
MTRLIRLSLIWLAIPLLLISFIRIQPQAESSEDTIVKLRLMETTDLHGYLIPYNFFNRKMSNRYGLAFTARLIKQARGQVKNSMLFDNGDLLNGSLVDDYVRFKGLKKGKIHPVYRAMNKLDYDAATVGNHDFNVGLDFMKRAIKGANFPYVNANVYYDDGDLYPENDRNYFKPYLIMPRTFVDTEGKKHTIKVGVIGFTLPQT